MMGRLRDFAVFIFFLCALQALFRDVQCQLEEAPCRPGTFLEDIFGKTPCVLCPRGTISTTVNANLCDKCPEGYTTMKAGSTECIPDVVICGRNSYVARSETYCPRGTYCHKSTGGCETCPQGTFMFFTSMLCCFSCPLKGTSTKRKGAWSPSECTTVPCVQDVRANSSFKSLELEWDPVIFPNAKYVVKIAKKGTIDWYHFHLDEETTKLFVPGLEPDTEYKYKICVVAGTVTVECEEHCISTRQLNLTISDTKGVIHNANPCPGYSFYIDFPECVNGTLILLQKLTLGPGGGLIINNVLYNDTFDTDPPTVLYVPPNTSVEVRGGNAERGEFKFFYNCTVPCVKNVRANSSFKSLKLEWDPVIFPNVKIIVKIAKKGTNIWYHFQLNQETTTLFVPDLEPGMKYKYKICVMIGPFSMECGEGCISTLPWNLTVCDEKGVIWERNMQPGCVTRVQFPKCVNGTLILLQQLALGPGGGLIVNKTVYDDSFKVDPPRVLYFPYNTSLEVRGGDVESGKFRFFFTCTDMVRIGELLKLMNDCTVRHCMKYDSFVEDLIALTNGDISVDLWTRLCPFTTLFAVRSPVLCSECREPPSCPAPWGPIPAECPCQFGLHGPKSCKQYPSSPWNCTVGKNRRFPY